MILSEILLSCFKDLPIPTYLTLLPAIHTRTRTFHHQILPGIEFRG